MAEVLIFVRGDAAIDPADARAVHRISARMAVVDDRVLASTPFAADPAAVVALTADDELTDELAGELTDEERLFAQSWLLQQTTSKQRPADGADWDAPGHEAPDAPDTDDVRG